MTEHKPNNIIYLKCSEGSFNRMWLEFLTPFHKLAAREKDVAARILTQYFRLKESCSEPVMLRELLWSQSSRLDMRSSLGLSQPHFQMILRKLRDVGFLSGEDINPRYLPHVAADSPLFELRVIFDRSTPDKPVTPDEAN